MQPRAPGRTALAGERGVEWVGLLVATLARCWTDPGPRSFDGTRGKKSRSRPSQPSRHNSGMRSEPQSLAAGRRSYFVTIAVLGAGAIATVLAALPYKVFDLDRYAIPKEFTLHLTATLAAVAAIVALGRSATRSNTRPTSPAIPLSRVDTLLIGF